MILDSFSTDYKQKVKLELQKQQEHEYFLMGSFFYNKALKLYSYNSMEKELLEVTVKLGDTAYVIPDGRGGLTWEDRENHSTMIDSKLIYFQSLNINSAEARIRKFYEGKIPDLFNLNPARYGAITW